MELKLSTTWPTQREHVFLGWARTADAAEAEYLPGDMYTEDADVTLYAVWMDAVDLGSVSGAKTYSIEYPVNGRSAYVKFTAQNSGKYVIHSVNSFYARVSATTWIEYEKTESGWTHWETVYAKKVDNDFEVFLDLEAGKTYHLMYYHYGNPLQLEITDQVYCVNYDGNGYNVSVGSQPKYPGVDLKLSATWPTQREHVFLGWARTADAVEAEFQPGDMYTEDADVTLYAVWMDAVDLGTVSGAKTYSIEYPVNRRSAYVKFTAKNSGKYVVHSVNSFYARVSASTWIEYEVTGSGWTHWETVYAKKVSNDFEVLLDLESGTTCYLMYYHYGNPLVLEILHQYPGLDFQPDAALPEDLSAIGDESFRGSRFTKVEIPENVRTVGKKAFADCEELEQVLVRSGDTRFERDAFEGCGTITVIAPEGSDAQAMVEECEFVYVELE